MTDAELRELDRQVAVEVMGIVARQVRPQGRTELVTVYSGNPTFSDGVWDKRDLEHYADALRYSTDIAAAWQVVEKFRPYIKVDARGLGDEEWVCSVWVGGPEIQGRGTTAPRAICRAALAAVRGKTTTEG